MIETLTPVVLSGGRGTPPASLNITQVSGFTSSDRYYTADGTGPLANTLGFSWWTVDVPLTVNQSTNNYQFLFGRLATSNGSRGWAARQFQACVHSIVDQQQYDVAYTLAQIYAQASNISWGELGQLRVLHFVIRNGVIYSYKNGILLGKEGLAAPGLLKSSIVNPAPTNGIGIGGCAGSQAIIPYEGGIVSCGIASSTGWSDNQVEAHYQALLFDPYATPAGATNQWKAKDAGATWVDSIGGLTANRFGNPSVATVNISYYPRYDVSAPAGDTGPIWPPIDPTEIRVLGCGDSETFEEGSYRLLPELYKVADGVANGVGVINYKWVGNTIWNPFKYGYEDHSNGITGTSVPATVSGSLPFFQPFYDEIRKHNPHVLILWYNTNASNTQSGIALEKSSTLQVLDIAYAFNPNIRVGMITGNTGMRKSATAGGGQAFMYHDMNNWKQQQVSLQRAMGRKVFIIKTDLAVAWDDAPQWNDSNGFGVHLTAPSAADPTADLGYNRIGKFVRPALLYACGYNYYP